MRRLALFGLLGGLAFAASCSSEPAALDRDHPTSAIANSITQSTIPDVSATDDPEGADDSAPTDVDTIPLRWPDVITLTDSFVLEPIFDGASVLVTSSLRATYEGAEGGERSHQRLDMVDLASGARTVLVDQLPENITTVSVGPNGRVAMLMGADANGTVSEFFTIDVDGTVTDRLVLADPIRFGANDTANPSWSFDGSVFHVQGQAIDASTGERLDETQLVFGEDEAGVQLIGSTDGDRLVIGWSDEVTEGPPSDRFPMPELAWSDDGSVLALIGPWEQTTTLIIDGVAQSQDGWVRPSPDGTLLAVESDATLVITDLAAAPLAELDLPDAWRRISWLDSDRLLVADQRPGGGFDLRVVSIDR